MKKILTLLIAIAFLGFQLKAQTPQAFNYQAVARDAAGLSMNNQNIRIEISILHNGNGIYTESHSVTTNEFGLFKLDIGDGVTSFGDFLTIDWSQGSYSVEVSMDENGGTNYTSMGGMQLLSVPFAMHAKTAENTFSGDYNDLSNQPNLPVNVSDLNNDAGYISNPDDADADASNELQVLTISNDTIFLSSGGFVVLPTAAAGFSGAFGDLTGVPAGLADGDDNTQLTEAQVDAFANNNGYLSTEVDGSITNELQAISISNDTIFLSSGGFVVLPTAAAGFSGAFGDLTGVPAGLADGDDNTQLTEAQVDAFANNNGYLSSEIDGSTTNELQNLNLQAYTLSISNGNSVNLANILPDQDKLYSSDFDTRVDVDLSNYTNEIVFRAGGTVSMVITDQGVEFPGYNKNIMLGAGAGLNDNLNGNHYNTYVGYEAGKTNVSSQFNTAVGGAALKFNTAGSNCAFGYSALYDNTTGNLNTAIGVYSLVNNTSGGNNIAVGNSALRDNTTGTENVAIGNSTGYVKNGSRNTLIGHRAGRQSGTSGDGNVFIGYKAGYYTTGSDKLVIGNDWSGTGSKLIYGDFSTGKVTIEKVLRLPPSSAPTSPETGDMYVSTNGHVYCYLGGVWKQLDN